MDDEPMCAADRVVAPTLGFAITIPETANEFTIMGNHLTLFKGYQFDGRIKTNPHKHIYEFLRICDMFRYKDTDNEAVRLMMFPLSLTGEATTWLDELNEGTIKTWDELRFHFADKKSRRPSGSLPSNTQLTQKVAHPNLINHRKLKMSIIDVIDEILEEDFDVLLDEGSKILYSFEGTIVEEKCFAEFDEFMAVTPRLRRKHEV
ncbi:hypothetical protein Tco_0699411 [Tanacetum coccineum]